MSGLVTKSVALRGGTLEIAEAGAGPHTICAVHPFAPLTAAAGLLARMSGARVVCVNPHGVGASSPPVAPDTLDSLVDDLEALRRTLQIDRWVYWGMSAGNFVGQLYVHRHPEAIAALALFSAGASFRDTQADPHCASSPQHRAWRDQLAAAGLLGGAPAGGGNSWERVDGVGWVLRADGGPALFVSRDEPWPRMRHVIPQLLAFDARPWLGGVRVPTLVMGGSADPIAPIAQVRALHQVIPGSSFVAVEGGGHDLVGERRPEIADAMARLLARVS